MDYLENTHCPNCFKPSQTTVCPACGFNRQIYLQQEAASHHLPVFSRLDKGYVLGRVLGEGSFAIVYAAIREKDGLACAVKEYYPQDLAQRGLDGKTVNPKRNHEQLLNWQRRFEQEGELLRCCYDYPSVESGVVRYTALIRQHNTTYLVMERLSGHNLTALLATQPTLRGKTICLWLKPLLETLQKLHSKEIYHRDISPNNIFLCAPNDPVLMDFGLAREGVRDAVLKSSTLGAGTFIAPEQLTGGYCDQRTDLYALGAVIYLCLLGEAPPPVEARRQGAPLGRLVQPDRISLALQTVATHCLQLDLQMRPQNAGQILAELSPFWTTHATPSPLSLETIIPGQTPHITPAFPSTVAHEYLPQHPQYPNPPPNYAASGTAIVKLVLMWGLGLGLAYFAFVSYQDYADEQQKSTKQDRLLFAEAQTLADFKNYLVQCVVCESKQDAENKIAELELEQQAKQTQKQQKREEHNQYIKAKTVEDLQAYLNSCVICQHKDKAEAELKQKLADAEAQKAAEGDPSLWDALTKPAVDAIEGVTQTGKAKPDEPEASTPEPVDLKAKIEAETRAKLEAEYRAKAEAEAMRAKTEAEIRAQLESEVKEKAYQEAKARLEAEAKAKADAEAKTKSDAAAAQKAQIEADMEKIKAIGEAAVKVFGDPSK